MKIKKLAITSLFLALGIIIPYVTSHAFSIPGTLLLPMHFCVFIGAMLLGWQYGLILGILTPILSMFITGMPNSTFVYIMVCELATYGLVAGLLHYNKKINIYVSLLISMVIGRLSYALSLFVLVNLLGFDSFSKVASVFTAISTGIIGIVIQIGIIPIIAIRLKKVINIE